TPHERLLGHTGVLVEPDGGREDLTALPRIEQEAEVEVLVRETVAEARGPVGVVVPELAHRGVDHRQAVVIDHDLPGLVPQVAGPPEHAVGATLTRLDLEAPVLSA